jgi:hypothetical protein
LAMLPHTSRVMNHRSLQSPGNVAGRPLAESTGEPSLGQGKQLVNRKAQARAERGGALFWRMKARW